MRRDLPLGFLAAQVVHAAGESIENPLPPGTNAVVLSVENEHHLHQIADELAALRAPYVKICEVDPPFSGQATAIGVSPVADRKTLKKVISKLPLLSELNTLAGCDNARPGLASEGTGANPVASTICACS